MSIANPCEACSEYNESISQYITGFMKGHIAALDGFLTVYGLMLDDNRKLDPKEATIMKPICEGCKKISIYDRETLQRAYDIYTRMKADVGNDPARFQERVKAVALEAADDLITNQPEGSEAFLEALREQLEG